VKQYGGAIIKNLTADSVVVLSYAVTTPYPTEIAGNSNLMIITEKRLSTMIDRLCSKAENESTSLIVNDVVQTEAKDVQRLLEAGRKACSPNANTAENGV
jgi:hypothetical protein